MCMLNTLNFMVIIGIDPSVIHAARLRSLEIHTPRKGNGGIGIPGRKTELGISTHSRINQVGRMRLRYICLSFAASCKKDQQKKYQVFKLVGWFHMQIFVFRMKMENLSVKDPYDKLFHESCAVITVFKQNQMIENQWFWSLKWSFRSV